MSYFNYFPKIGYDLRGAEDTIQLDKVTNILARVLLKHQAWKTVGSTKDFLDSAAYFVKYVIRDGDRPDTLAHQYYGDSELHWLICYTNGINLLHPLYDWPMTQYDLKKFIQKKYGNANINAIHHYKDANGYQVDSTAAGATSVTNWIYEELLNDSKRTISIMQKKYIGQVVDEFKRLMKTH